MGTILSRTYAGLLGLFMVAIGALGFVGSFVTQELLFGYFHVDTIHNIIYLISGVIGMVAAFANARFAARYILAISLVFGVLTILGFIMGGNFFSLTVLNNNDNFLHAGISILSMLVCLFLIMEEPRQFIGFPGGDSQQADLMQPRMPTWRP